MRDLSMLRTLSLRTGPGEAAQQRLGRLATRTGPGEAAQQRLGRLATWTGPGEVLQQTLGRLATRPRVAPAAHQCWRLPPARGYRETDRLWVLTRVTSGELDH